MRSRRMTVDEQRLLRALIKRAKSSAIIQDDTNDFLVESLPDGGMGSLRFVPPSVSPNRKFGTTVSDLEFDDTDGTKVYVALNVDQNGSLFEIDIWRTDFVEVHHIPENLE
ncbi:MAG: hypothetical protein QM785_02500 [Pyrinomonadaceae bacterium]